MAFTFQDLRKLKNDIAAAAGISTAAAARVIGYYNGAGPALRPDVVRAMMGGDLSHVGPALSALGLPAAALATPQAVQDSQQKDITNDNKPVKAHTTPHNAQKTIIDTLPPAQALPATMDQKSQAADPDIITDTCDYSDVLPPGLYDAITAIIDNYCKQQSITDRMKIHPLQWQGICYRVGDYIKQHKIIHDFFREKIHGGTVYDGNKLTALLILYGVICSDFKQVAFTFNFARFAGVSTDYLHDYMQKGLTSARVGLREKALEIQKASLVGAVTGGGSATVGNIFLSKALAGLQESTTVVHVSAAPSVSLSELPQLGINDG